MSDESDVYKNAALELKTLVELDYQPWLLNVVIREDPNVRREIEALRAIFSDYDLSLDLRDGSGGYFAGTDSREALWVVKGGSVLSNVDRLFHEVHKIVGHVVPGASVEAHLRKILDERRHEIPAEVRDVSLDISPSSSGMDIRINWGFGPSYSQSIGISVKQPRNVIRFAIPVDLLSELRADERTAILVGPDGVFLPKTKAVWAEVQGNSASEAREFLARRSVEQEGSLEVLGVSVQQQRLLWAAPSILVIVSMYLAIHVWHLRRLAARTNSLADYPWIPLMRDRWAQAFAAATFIVLPAATAWLTVRATWDSINTWERALTIAEWVAALLLIGWAFWILQTIGANRERTP